MEDQMSAATTTPTTPRPTAASDWTLDPAHTQVGFAVRHMMFATVKGRFTTVEGALRLDGTAPVSSEVRIDAASIDTGNAQRDEHLRSADFFDVASYPALTWVGRGVERLGGSKYRLTGDLTIRGVTREVVLEAEETGRGVDPWGQEKLGFTASTRIDRKDFGLTWNQALEAGGVLVSDEVRITIDGQAVRA
jgi:polyisoprenoid-binding protein YceI